MILIESLKITKFAALSRATAGVRNNKTLIVNLPGSKKGSQESLEIILPVLKHALDLLRDSKESIKKDHSVIQGTTTTSQTTSHSCGGHHHHHHHHEGSKSRITDKDISERPRKSSYPMISVEEAIERILKNTEPLGSEEVAFMDSLSRISASDIIARDPLPPFAASVKDGFAIKLTREQREYIEKKSTNSSSIKWIFKVIGASNAGDSLVNLDLNEGECVKINTGAPVPLKADAVVQIEDTRALEKHPQSGLDSVIEVIATSGCGGSESHDNHVDIKIGQEIRPIGFDISIGETVVSQGMLIKPAQIGICATVGALRVNVFKQPTVGLISTGNELCKPEDQEKLGAGKIRDSNKSLLHAALKSFGINNVFDAGIASDDCDSVLKIFRDAMKKSDVIISTGGVSMGDKSDVDYKDLVKDVLEKDLNCTIHFARMNMKPGKPTTFATCEYEGKRKLFFGLPGNPVSAIVTFNLVVMPCLKKLLGYKNPHFTEIKVKCEFDADLDPRPEYHRCLLKWQQSNESDSFPSAFSTGNQHSSRLLSMNEADCLVKLPPRTAEKTSIRKGEILNALLINNI